MMTDLHNEELAEHLAKSLTDLEFELLVRARIRRMFEEAEMLHGNLCDSHHYCTYTHSWGDEGVWNCKVGENYSRSGRSEGQVLTKTVAGAIANYAMHLDNKLSGLLPAPTPSLNL